jgi:carbon-monoxide dehydrogenase large subunit
MLPPLDLDRAIGQPVERVEDPRLLRGRGQYVDDLRREGMLHAAVARSSVPHGRLTSVNVKAALAMPGVRAVYTAADIVRESGGRMPTIPMRLIPMAELIPYEEPVMAADKVRYVGEPVALVVADSAAQAEDALEALVVEVEMLPPVPNRHVAARNESLLFEAQGTNKPITYAATKGDPKAKAPYVRRETFSVQRHTAVAMEPRGLLAQWNGSAAKLTVTGAAKVPFNTRKTLARCLDLPEECVDMIECEVGGGFGVRGEFYPEDFLIPFAARRLGRPVKWVEDRRENLLASNHSREMDIELEIACERDGRMIALHATAWVDAGAYLRTSVAILPRTLCQGISGPYDIPNVHIEASMMLSNKAPAGTYRGPGRFEGTFFRERLMDMIAADLGLDPVEFRSINLVKPAQMPYRIASIRPATREEHFDGGDYPQALARCAAEIGWEKNKALQGKLVGGRRHGLGFACFIEGGAAGPRENVRLELGADGWLSLYTGSANVGQGMETVCVQIASDALRFPMERIRVFHGSTTLVKEGFGAFHSRCVVVGGSAIVDAAAKLRDEIGKAAAARLGCAARDVVVGENLIASFGGTSLAPRELAQAAPLVAEGTFESHHHTYAYGAAAAHVAVDPRTGHVELIDYVMVEDVGRIINPLTMHGQAIGGIVQGLGGTFLEHLAYDDEGQFLSGSLADYLMPAASDYPNIRAIVTGEHPSPNNPLGAKGGGDGGVVPVGGAVGNAVAAALAPLGARITSLPLSPDRVWAAVQAGPGSVIRAA